MAAGAQPIKHQDIEPLTERKAWKALEVVSIFEKGLYFAKATGQS